MATTAKCVFDIRGLVVAAADKRKTARNQLAGGQSRWLQLRACQPGRPRWSTSALPHNCDRSKAATWLGNASSRFVYHFGEMLDASGNPQWGQHMPGACGIVRERHASQVAADAAHDNPLQIALECSDGSGTVLMKKVQAEPDPETGNYALDRQRPDGAQQQGQAGQTIRARLQRPTSAANCRKPTAFPPLMYYDAPGRPVRVEMPDGTFSRVEFSPWFSRSFDANDTVLESDWYQQLGRNHLDPERRCLW